MPLNIASSLQTLQPYIPLITPADRVKVPGMTLTFADATAFATWVTAERSNIALALPVVLNGTAIRVLSEPAGVSRVWSLDTVGADDAAKAAASHGKTVVYADGRSLVLAGDANVVTSTSGAPVSGGANGDLAVDFAAGRYYIKSAGVWPATGTVFQLLGEASNVFAVPSAGNVVLTTPGPLPNQYGEDTAIVRQPASGTPGGYSNASHIVDGVLPPIRATLGAELHLLRYTNDFGASYHLQGIQRMESIGEWAWPDLRLLSATTYNGCVAWVTGLLTDVDGAGAARAVPLVARDGRWRYLSGSQVLRQMAVEQTAHTSLQASAQIIGSAVRFPYQLLQPGDRIEYWLSQNKLSGAATAGYRIYIGTAGNATDTLLIDGDASMSATQQSFGIFQHLRANSATAIRQLGGFAAVTATAQAIWTGVSQNSPVKAAFTVPDFTTASADRFLTFVNYLGAGATTDTIQAVDLRVMHHMAA